MRGTAFQSLPARTTPWKAAIGCRQPVTNYMTTCFSIIKYTHLKLHFALLATSTINDHLPLIMCLEVVGNDITSLLILAQSGSERHPDLHQPHLNTLYQRATNWSKLLVSDKGLILTLGRV